MKALDSPLRWRLSLRAGRDPQALTRVLNLFAQRGVPVEMLTVAREADYLRVEIQDVELDAHSMSVLVQNLRTMVLVSSANLSESPPHALRRVA